MPLKMKPINVLVADLGLENKGEIHAYFTQLCANYMTKYVPYSEGDLSEQITIETDKITYEMPYAHYMYIGQVMGPNVPIKKNGLIVGWFSPVKPKHYTGKEINYYKGAGHELAGSYWDIRMWSAEKGKIARQLQRKIDGKK